MKILWISPYGEGWAMAYKLRAAGNKVVLWSGNKNGLGYLPQVAKADLESYITKADMVVMDANAASRPTRRSYEPSDLVMMLNAAVKKRGIPYIGPIPTSELIENDSRYCAKVLRRLGLEASIISDSLSWLSADPSGSTSLIVSSTEAGVTTSDVGIPSSLRSKPIEKLTDFLRGIGYNGYLNVQLTVGFDGSHIGAIKTSFLYPAIFGQFGSSLLDAGFEVKVPLSVSLAVTVFAVDDGKAERMVKGSEESLAEQPGFFPYELKREGNSDRLNGAIVGALVGIDTNWERLVQKTEAELGAMARLGWGYSLPADVPERIAAIVH